MSSNINVSLENPYGQVTIPRAKLRPSDNDGTVIANQYALSGGGDATATSAQQQQSSYTVKEDGGGDEERGGCRACCYRCRRKK